MVFKRRLGRPDCDWRCELYGIAVRTGRDRRECDRPATELVRELDRAPMARSKQLGLAFAAAVPDRADRVEHMLYGQRPARGRLHVSRVAAAEPTTLLENRRPTRTVDRAVHAAAAEQAGIRRVDYRVDLLLRDVAEDELDHACAGRGKRTGRSAGSGISPCLKPIPR